MQNTVWQVHTGYAKKVSRQDFENEVDTRWVAQTITLDLPQPEGIMNWIELN